VRCSTQGVDDHSVWLGFSALRGKGLLFNSYRSFLSFGRVLAISRLGRRGNMAPVMLVALGRSPSMLGNWQFVDCGRLGRVKYGVG